MENTWRLFVPTARIVPTSRVRSRNDIVSTSKTLKKARANTAMPVKPEKTPQNCLIESQKGIKACQERASKGMPRTSSSVCRSRTKRGASSRSASRTKTLSAPGERNNFWAKPRGTIPIWASAARSLYLTVPTILALAALNAPLAVPEATLIMSPGLTFSLWASVRPRMICGQLSSLSGRPSSIKLE